MGTEIKLVAGCILALTIGILAVSPLMLSMLNTTKAQTVSGPYFKMDIPYAYISVGNSSSSEESVREFCMVFNATSQIKDSFDLPDAVIEYFQIQIYTERGPVENITQYVGAAFNDSFTPQTFNSFIFNRAQWFDTRTSGGGIFAFNWTTDHSQLNMLTGNTNSLPNYQGTNEIIMKVNRIGSIIFKGNSTIASISNTGEIEQLQLTKYKDGFLYNTIIPADQLSQMDPLKPTVENQT